MSFLAHTFVFGDIFSETMAGPFFGLVSMGLFATAGVLVAIDSIRKSMHRESSPVPRKLKRILLIVVIVTITLISIAVAVDKYKVNRYGPNYYLDPTPTIPVNQA